MPDEAVDTQTTPQGTEGEPTTETIEAPEETVTEETPAEQPPPVTPPPTPLTPEEIEERAFQRTASWMGRREKEFSDNILRNVTQVIESKLAGFQPHAPAAPSTDPATMLENPDAWAENVIPRIMDKVVAQRTQKDQAYMSDFIREAGSMMDSDPLFQGEDGKKLGSEVVAEVQKNIGNLDRSIPAGMAAKLFIANSALNVVRQRTAVKQNALAGNRPASGIGTLKAPGASPTPKPPPVKLDDMAKKVANWFGNSEEEVRNFLK